MLQSFPVLCSALPLHLQDWADNETRESLENGVLYAYYG